MYGTLKKYSALAPELVMHGRRNSNKSNTADRIIAHRSSKVSKSDAISMVASVSTRACSSSRS